MFLINSCQGNFRCGRHNTNKTKVKSKKLKVDERRRAFFFFLFSFSSFVLCRQALSRSYGCFFAEFLGELSLVRLGLLDPNTCVGLRYDSLTFMLRSFSWKPALPYPLGLPLKFLLCLRSTLKSASRIYQGNALTAQTQIQ